MRSPRLESSSSRIDGLELTSIISFASGLPLISTNMSIAATRSPMARVACRARRDCLFGWYVRQHHRAPRARFIRRESPAVRPLQVWRRTTDRDSAAKPARGRGSAGHRYGRRANHRTVCTPSPVTDGGYFRAQYSTSSSRRKTRYSVPSTIGWISTAS